MLPVQYQEVEQVVQQYSNSTDVEQHRSKPNLVFSAAVIAGNTNARWRLVAVAMATTRTTALSLLR